jgi:predicted transcriptional regulator
MMTIIGGIWPYLVGLAGLAAGIFMTMFSNQKVKTAEATTEQHKAIAAQALSDLANVSADQKATDEAEQARQAAIAKKAIQDAAIASQPPGAAFTELQNDPNFSR